MTGLHWGRARENGIWLAPRSRHRRHWRRLCWRGHDSLYLAAGCIRVRIMKPSRYQQVTVPAGFAAQVRRSLHEAVGRIDPDPGGLAAIRAKTRHGQ
jgi:hypothetical protein